MKTAEQSQLEMVSKYTRFLSELYLACKVLTDNNEVDRIFRKFGIKPKVITVLVKSGIIHFDKYLHLPKDGSKMMKFYFFTWNTLPPDILLASHVLELVRKSEEIVRNCEYCGEKFGAIGNRKFCSAGCKRAYDFEGPAQPTAKNEGWFRRAISGVKAFFTGLKNEIQSIKDYCNGK